MHTIRVLAAALPLAIVPLLAAGPASAASDGTYEVPLNPLNSSGSHGTALVELKGTRLTVDIKSSGLVPNSVHAAHLHGGVEGKEWTCPTAADVSRLDTDHNGILNTTEAAIMYGAIMISLTTTADTTMNSGLAIDRFPKADAKGNLSYHRTFTISAPLAKNLSHLHIVQHGLDGNHDGKYDGDTKSDLNPALPAEATDPADCGALSLSQLQGAPVGAVATGGGTSGPSQLPMYLLGGTALLAGAGVVTVASRRRTVGVTE